MIQIGLKGFLDKIKEPSTYKNQPLLFIQNQIGHSALGFALSTFGVMLHLLFFGVYPIQYPIVIFFTVLYLFGWELYVQGNNGVDTLLDTWFFLLGASLFLFIDMQFVIGRLTAFVLIVAGSLTAGYILVREVEDD